jgi:hypothetical protein
MPPGLKCEHNPLGLGHIEIATRQSLPIRVDEALLSNRVDTSPMSWKTKDNAIVPTHPPWPFNKTGYRGVMQRRKGQWAAKTYDSKRKCTLVLGVFDNPEAAARAYDKAVVDIHGSRAKLNFPSADHQAVTAARPARRRSRKESRRRAIHEGVVPWPGGKWGAQVSIKMKNYTAKVWLGTFVSFELAVTAIHEATIDFRRSNGRLKSPARNYAPNMQIATCSALEIDGTAEGQSAALLQLSTGKGVSKQTAPTNISSYFEPELSDGYLYLDEIESTEML